MASCQRHAGEMMERAEKQVDDLLFGAIDPHVHSGPSIAERSIDHLQLVKEMSAVGYAAVITKDHDYSGAACAQLIQRNFPEMRTKAYSSIVLNNAVGGMNPYAVELAAAMGAKIVWLPTLSAERHLEWKRSSNRVHPGESSKMREPIAVPVLDPDGTVRDDVKEILDVTAAAGLALASGHIHISETWRVFEEAQRRGVRQLVLTHPESIVEASLNDVRGIAQMGAMIEHSSCLFLSGSKFKRFGGEDLKRQIDAAGVQNTILCSDQGQKGEMSPIEGFRSVISLCLSLGYTADEIRMMTSTNAARAFNIDVQTEASQ